MNRLARRCALLWMCLLAATFAGCGGGDDGGTGPDPTPVTVTGTWSGGGHYYGKSDGSPLSMDYTLTLNLVQQGNAVTGTFTFTRPVLGTRSGPGSGTAADGVISMHLEPDYDLEGTYTEGTISFDWTEHLRTGIDLYATGNVTRQ